MDPVSPLRWPGNRGSCGILSIGRPARRKIGTVIAGQEVEHSVGRWLGDQAVGPVLAQYAYLGAGTVIQETFTEPQIRLNYDPAGDGSLTGLDRFSRAVDHLLQQDDGQLWSPIDRFRYGYDAAGNRTWRENVLADAAVGKNLSEAYVYDELYRLIGTDRGRFGQGGFVKQTDYQAWTLDGLGNFAQFKENGDGQGGWALQQERTVNAANEITGLAQGQGQAAWIAPLYDAAGNVASAPAPGHETTRLHFTYDAWNRMVQVYADDAQQPGQPGDLLAEYFYDGVKRRIEKVLTAAAGQAGSVAYYHNVGWQVLEERAFDDQHEPTHTYQTVWSPRYLDAPILRDECDTAGGLEAGARLYYLGDANYNVTALVGLVEVEPAVFAWQVVERYAYDPYGKAAYFDAEFEPLDPQQSAHDNASLFAGYRYDAETGLYHARHRYYHSTLATWITRDPLGYAAGDASLYRYVTNNPVLLVDLSGLVQSHPHGKAIDLGNGLMISVHSEAEVPGAGNVHVHINHEKYYVDPQTHELFQLAPDGSRIRAPRSWQRAVDKNKKLQQYITNAERRVLQQGGFARWTMTNAAMGFALLGYDVYVDVGAEKGFTLAPRYSLCTSLQSLDETKSLPNGNVFDFFSGGTLYHVLVSEQEPNKYYFQVWHTEERWNWLEWRYMRRTIIDLEGTQCRARCRGTWGDKMGIRSPAEEPLG